MAARGSRAWLAVYLAGLLFAPLADARLEMRAATERVTHVEPAGAPACPPVHDHSACPVCRTIWTAATPPTTPGVSGPSVVGGPASPEILADSTSSFGGPLGARAPPAV